MQRLRRPGTTILPHLKKKTANSLAAAQDTFFSVKEVFERHRIVFTIGTSIASVATAWAGYSLRHYHDSRVDKRLESIENAMKDNHHFENAEFKKIVDAGKNSGTAACIATAGTTLVIGYGLGWRGGRWYAHRQFRKEQMKLLGQVKPQRWQLLGKIKPKGWQLQLLRKPVIRARSPENASKASEISRKDAPVNHNNRGTQQSC